MSNTCSPRTRLRGESDLTGDDDKKRNRVMYHRRCKCKASMKSLASGIRTTRKLKQDVKSRGTRTRMKLSRDVDKMSNKTQSGAPREALEVTQEGVLDAVSTASSTPSCVTVLTNTINCRTEGDGEHLGVTDVIFTIVAGIQVVVVSDESNQCIKSFFKRKNRPCYDRLALKHCPWAMAKLESNKLAVTLSTVKQIVTISVAPELSLLSSMKTKKEYSGLTALSPTTLAAGCWTPPCVDILDVSGNILKCISPRIKGNSLIQWAYALGATKKGNILVSDHGTKSVLCLTPQGDVVFNYCPTGDSAIANPIGITATDTGDILFVDHNKHKLIQLSDSGQFVRNVLTEMDGLCAPTALYYEGGTIYVSHYYDGIQVFTCK